MTSDPIFLARVARGFSPVRTITGGRRAGLDDTVPRRALRLRLVRTKSPGAHRVIEGRHVAQIEIDPSLLGDRGFRVDDLYVLLRRHFTHFVDLNRRAKGAREDVVVFSLGTAS